MSIPKLSEAIRLGIGLFPQGTCWRDCTLATALAAIGRNRHYNPQETGDPRDVVIEVWPWLKTVIASPKGHINPALQVIEGLNGFRRVEWSREHIADFVETIEQQLEAQATPQLEVEHVTN